MVCAPASRNSGRPRLWKRQDRENAVNLTGSRFRWNTFTRYSAASRSISSANFNPLQYPSYWFCDDLLLSSVSDREARSYPASIAIFRMFARCFCPCFGSPRTNPITCGAQFVPVEAFISSNRGDGLYALLDSGAAVSVAYSVRNNNYTANGQRRKKSA